MKDTGRDANDWLRDGDSTQILTPDEAYGGARSDESYTYDVAPAGQRAGEDTHDRANILPYISSFATRGRSSPANG